MQTNLLSDDDRKQATKLLGILASKDRASLSVGAAEALVDAKLSLEALLSYEEKSEEKSELTDVTINGYGNAVFKYGEVVEVKETGLECGYVLENSRVFAKMCPDTKFRVALTLCIFGLTDGDEKSYPMVAIGVENFCKRVASEYGYGNYLKTSEPISMYLRLLEHYIVMEGENYGIADVNSDDTIATISITNEEIAIGTKYKSTWCKINPSMFLNAALFVSASGKSLFKLNMLKGLVKLTGLMETRKGWEQHMTDNPLLWTSGQVIYNLDSVKWLTSI